MSDEQGTTTSTDTETVENPDATSQPTVETPPTSESPPETPPTPEQEPGIPPKEETPPKVEPTNAEETETPPERVVPGADGYTFPKGVPADFGKFANSLDMTQEQADGVLKAHTGMKQAEMQAVREAGEAHVKNWGDRADYNMNLAKRAMKQHDPEGKLTELLNTTGFGNHPTVLEYFFTVGKGLQEGGFLKSELKAPGEKTRAQRMYPDMKSETL